MGSGAEEGLVEAHEAARLVEALEAIRPSLFCHRPLCPCRAMNQPTVHGAGSNSSTWQRSDGQQENSSRAMRVAFVAEEGR